MSEGKELKPNTNATTPTSSVLSPGMLITIFKETGLLGFTLIILTLIFLLFSTREQKGEFIDKYVLLKDFETNPGPAILIFLALVLILILQTVYNRLQNKGKNAELNRVKKELKLLQDTLIRHRNEKK